MSSSTPASHRIFHEAYITIKKDLVADFVAEGMPTTGLEWYERNIDFNLPGGKLNRGLAILDTVEVMKDRELTEDECFKVAVMGWCIELIQAYFLVTDDLMDGSLTRRGHPCYYKVVGLVSVNDACLLRSAVHVLLRKYFSEEKYYGRLQDAVLDTIYKTEMGQMLDTITSTTQNSDRYDLNTFSLEKYSKIVIYKTAFYSFYLPVFMGLLLCDVPTPPREKAGDPLTDPYQRARDILLPMGEYFQVQDDYLDAFTPPEILGKIGTDIIDGKCSWCICKTLSLASPEQIEVLKKNYGTNEVGSEEEKTVKRVYDEVGLKEKYAKYQAEFKTEFYESIEDVERVGLKKGIFIRFFNKIYGRDRKSVV